MDLKIKDVADLLNVSETTIRRWLSEEKIPAYRINHQYRFNRTEIEDWVMSQKLGRGFGSTNREEKPEKKSSEKNKSSGGGSKQFSLYRALHKGDVIYEVPGRNKEEVIRATMKSLHKSLNLDADEISELLLERERLQPTGLGNGVGIPHAREHLLSSHHDVVILAFPEKALAYGSLDGKNVHSLFFLFACEDKRHLHLLAKIAHLSSLPDTIKLLKSRPSKEILLDYIKTWESSI
jgi:PTS system nitrogen regulatory IIA component